MLDLTIFSQFIKDFEQFYRFELSPLLLKTYYKSLKDWEDEEFIAVCEQILEKEEFFPKIPTFNKYRTEKGIPMLEEYRSILGRGINTPTDDLNIPLALKNALKSVPNWRQWLNSRGKESEAIRGQILEALANSQKMLPSSDRSSVQILENKTYWFGDYQVRVDRFDDCGRAMIHNLRDDNYFLLLPDDFSLLSEVKQLTVHQKLQFSSPEKTEKITVVEPKKPTEEDLREQLRQACDFFDFLEKEGASQKLKDKTLEKINKLEESLDAIAQFKNNPALSIKNLAASFAMPS